MPTLGKSGTDSTICRITFLLKNIQLGGAHCLKIHRSHHTSNGSKEEVKMIGWSKCDRSNMELYWTILSPEIESSGDGKIQPRPRHICQLLTGAGMECIAITNLKLEQNFGDEISTAKIHSKPFSKNDKMQAWERFMGPKVLEGVQLRNFYHQGLCLGSNSGTSLKPLEYFEHNQLFVENKCGNSLKIRWLMEHVKDTNGIPKCAKLN